MYELVPCPRCRKGRIHYLVGYDVWTDCPSCGGSGVIKTGVVINERYSGRLVKSHLMKAH